MIRSDRYHGSDRSDDGDHDHSLSDGVEPGRGCYEDKDRNRALHE